MTDAPIKDDRLPDASTAIEVVTPLLERRRGGAEVTVRTLDDLTFLQNLATALAGSRYFSDAQTAERAAVKILAGQELGIGPVAALTNLHVIEGRIELSANLMAATVKRHDRYDYRVLATTAEACRIQFFEDGEPAGVSEFTMADATRAQLGWSREHPFKGPQSPRDPRSPWSMYPRAMLFARAMSQGCRLFAPDVFYGLPVYVEGEIDESYRMSDDEAAAYFGGDEAAAATVVEQVTDRAEEARAAEYAGPIPDEPAVEVVDTETGEVMAAADAPPEAKVTPVGEVEAIAEVGCPSCNADEALAPMGEGPDCPTCGGDRYVPETWVHEDPATERQMRRLGTLASDLGWDDDEAHLRAGVKSYRELTADDARRLGREWQSMLKAAHAQTHERVG